MGGVTLSPISSQQFLQDMIAYAQANSSLTSFGIGDPERAILESVAIELAAQSLAVTTGTEQYAVSGAETAFGFPALPATFATGSATFSGAGGTVVPSGTQISTAPAPGSSTVTYQTTQAGTLPSGSGTQTLSIAISALAPGAASNVIANTLTNLVVSVPGISSVTNPAAINNGQNAQNQAQQQSAFSSKIAGLMEGVAASLVQAAKSVSGIQQSGVLVNPQVDCLTITSAGAVTDNTTEANLPWGAPFPCFASSPSVGDSLVVGGGNVQFDKVFFNFAVDGAGISGSWQYWNGSWTALTVTDGTSSLSKNGTVTFTAPSDWVQTTFGGYQGYFIRFTLSSATYTTMATVNHVLILNPPPGVADVVVANGANTLGATLLSQVATAVQAVRLPGITGNVKAATILQQNVTASVTVASGYAQTTVGNQVVTAITQYLNGLAIGASATTAAMTSACFQVPGVTNVTFDPPTADVNVPADTLIVPGTIQAITSS